MSLLFWSIYRLPLIHLIAIVSVSHQQLICTLLKRKKKGKKRKKKEEKRDI